MDPDILQENADSRARLRVVIDRLDEGTLALSVRDGWTISALLAHLAFWDHSNLVRWDAFARAGSFGDISDEMEAFINECSLPMWRAVPGHTATVIALEAAEAVDQAAAALSAEALAYIEQTGRSPMLNHAEHRSAHLDEIESALMRHEVGAPV